MESQPAEALDIRLKGQRTAASFKDLQDAFGEPGQAVEIRAGEEKYLAARVSFPGVLIIAFRPM